MIKKIAFTFCFITLLSFTFTNNFRDLVLKKLEIYENNYPEKIYVHTDKPYYALGESIWYTAYLVNGITHKATEKSNVIYVELVNEKDSIIQKRQLFTSDVSVAGDFKIDKDLSPGNYVLRAYTNYMRNDSNHFFFQKEVPIWNTSDVNETIQSTTQSIQSSELIAKPKISFYPEGGYLINGISTKVAIKVEDKLDRTIEIMGTIKDSDGETISSFKTFDYGLGLASIRPEPNKSYYASVTINDIEHTYNLPKPLPEGYNIGIINSGNKIILRASSNTAIGLKNSYLVAHQRGRIIFERFENELINEYLIQLKTEDLTEGVTSFTLFNNEGKPVCERLAYVENMNEHVKINLNTNADIFKQREKVTMQINLKDTLGYDISGNLSMTITDLDMISQNSRSENIKTYLLLNSDLRGQIENPGYFFEKPNDTKRRFLLDLVMLTNGWRRFTWNSLLYDKADKKLRFEPEKGIYISGYTKALKGEKTAIQTATRLTLMSDLPYQEKKKTTIDGNFRYGPFMFNDTIPALIEARLKDFQSDDEKKNRFVSIDLDESGYSSPKMVRQDLLKNSFNDSTKISNFLLQSKKIAGLDSLYLENATRLDAVVIKAKKKTEEEERTRAFNERTLHGSPSNRIDMADFENQRDQSIFDLLNTLPGVTAFNQNVSIRNQGTPKILLDGMTVDISTIAYMTGNEVDFIDVLKGPDAAVYSNAGNGVIAIFTRTGEFDRNINVKRKPGIIDFKAIGFYTAREFYAPDYSNTFEERFKEDLRSTLYWEPKITLSKENPMADISFYTSDSPSVYGVTIEGITDSGVPVYHFSTFEVN